jgi:hypothetical protein
VVSGVMSAVESDVPKPVLDGLLQTEARIDSARFHLSSDDLALRAADTARTFMFNCLGHRGPKTSVWGRNRRNPPVSSHIA